MSDRYPYEQFGIMLPKNYLVAIGALATEMAWIEQCLDLLMWNLIGYTGPNEFEPGPIVTYRMNTPKKMRTIRALASRYKKHNKQWARDLEALLKEADRQSTARNEIIHAVWQVYMPVDNSSPRLFQIIPKVSARAGWNPHVGTPSVSDIESEIKTAAKLRNDCVEIAEQAAILVATVHEALREKRQQQVDGDHPPRPDQ